VLVYEWYRARLHAVSSSPMSNERGGKGMAKKAKKPAKKAAKKMEK
jgi:hypothetical protein